MEGVLDGWVDAAKVMWSICYGKEGHKPKGEMLTFSMFLPSAMVMNLGHDQKKRCWIQAAKTNFLRRVVGPFVGEELCKPEKV